MMEKQSIDMIFKMIDDAIDKKDRYINIFIGAEGISTNVYPYEMGHQKWIRVSIYDGNKDIVGYKYRCPECGNISHLDSPYCPLCGEQLTRDDY